MAFRRQCNLKYVPTPERGNIHSFHASAELKSNPSHYSNMSRRLRLTLWIGCIVPVVLIAVLVGVFLALRYEPKFYREALAVEPEVQEKGSDEMLQRTAALVSNVRKPGKWQARFTAEQINGWLAVDFVKNHREALSPIISAIRACRSSRIASCWPAAMKNGLFPRC